MSRSGCPRPSSQSVGAPRPGCSQLPGRPVRAARPWLRPAWSALSSGSCRAPLRDVEGSTVSSPTQRLDAGCPVWFDAMPHGEMSGGLSAILGTRGDCDAALGTACASGAPGAASGALGAVDVAPGVRGALDSPTRLRRSATAARSRMSSVLSGRGAGASMPPRDIALITPPGYRSPPGGRHEPYVYKSRGRTLTLCTGTKGAGACSAGGFSAGGALWEAGSPLAPAPWGGRFPAGTGPDTAHTPTTPGGSLTPSPAGGAPGDVRRPRPAAPCRTAPAVRAPRQASAASAPGRAAPYGSAER